MTVKERQTARLKERKCFRDSSWGTWSNVDIEKCILTPARSPRASEGWPESTKPFTGSCPPKVKRRPFYESALLGARDF